MKKRVFAALMAAVTVAGLLAGCGGGSDAGTGGAETGEEGKIINIYSWNDEFRTRLEAVYPEVESTSDDGTVTTLKDGTEIHWVINPNQDGVYQQKLDEALMNQADAAADRELIPDPEMHRARRKVKSLISTAGMMNSAPVWKLSIRKLRVLPMTEQ